MIETIIDFLGSNKAVLSAIVSIGEGIIVLVNLWRQFRNKSGGEVANMAAPPPKFKAFLWAANPINLFRKTH
jgi:hypothetical protein